MAKERNENLYASRAESYTSFYGVLAGLTFTASVLVFQYRAEIAFGNILLTLTLVTTMLFVFAAAVVYDVAGAIVGNRLKAAENNLILADKIGVLGFVALLFDIAFIAFIADLAYGLIVLACEIGILIYLARNYK